jgi:hypothetical protein
MTCHQPAQINIWKAQVYREPNFAKNLHLFVNRWAKIAVYTGRWSKWP